MRTFSTSNNYEDFPNYYQSLHVKNPNGKWYYEFKDNNKHTLSPGYQPFLSHKYYVYIISILSYDLLKMEHGPIGCIGSGQMSGCSLRDEY